MDKKQLRSEIRARKRAMTEEEIAEKSRVLTEKFLDTDAYRSARTIYGYLPYNQEVRTVPLLEQAIRDGKQVAVPKVYGEEMKFILMDDLERWKRAMPEFRSLLPTGPWRRTNPPWC